MITAESLFFAILGTTRAEITPSVLATEITAGQADRLRLRSRKQ